MARPAGPFDLWRLGLQMQRLAWETQVVMTLRVLGMWGFWPVSRGESRRMVAEKPPAFARAAMAAGAAAMQGRRPDEIAAAAVAPLRRKTRGNARRLTRPRSK